MSGTTTETSNFDATVAQYETTDPVLGGATGQANAPIINLTNRTRWLYSQVVTIEGEIPLLAPKASPTFTGSVAMQGGALAIGNPSVKASAGISFQTSGAGNGQDVGLTASGGSNGTGGQGALAIAAAGGITATGSIVVPAASVGFSVGTPANGNAAAFLAILPTNYANYTIQITVGGTIVYHVDAAGNVVHAGTLSATGAISTQSNLSVSGYANIAGTIYGQTGAIVLGSGSSTSSTLSFRSAGSNNTNAYDAQIASSGGASGTAGQGKLTVAAAAGVTVDGTVTSNPAAANTAAFVAGTQPASMGAAFFANMPASFALYLAQLCLNGTDLFHVDNTGDVVAAGLMSQGQQPPALDKSGRVATTAWAAGTLDTSVANVSPDGGYRGYHVLPSGLIIQWGSDTTQSSNYGNPQGNGNLYNFGLAFPNKCFGCIAQEGAAGGWNTSSSPGGPAATIYGIDSVTTTGFGLSCAGFTVASNGTVSLKYDGNAGFFFIAIGY